jgi:hypothetical protein
MGFGRETQGVALGWYERRRWRLKPEKLDGTRLKDPVAGGDNRDRVR